MQSHVGTKFTDKDVSDYLWSTLKSGRVVPGYGHAVLRQPDPRFNALMDFASSRPDIASDPVFQLVKKNSEIAPEVLKEHGKTKVCVKPYPPFLPRLSLPQPAPVLFSRGYPFLLQVHQLIQAASLDRTHIRT